MPTNPEYNAGQGLEPVASSVATPSFTRKEKGSSLEKYKKKKKFDQEGYQRGKSRTVDYDSRKERGQDNQRSSMSDNRSYTA